MDEKLKAILERTLKATEALANAASVADTKYLVTLLGIFRVSFTTLRDIYYLSQSVNTGSSILDLTRKIIEHGIAVEYMLIKGREEMATRFQDFMVVQKHEEIELMEALGVDPSTLDASLKLSIEEIKRDFQALSSKKRNDRTWAGIDFIGMLKVLTDGGVIKAEDQPRLLSAYVWGSRLNHPNPLVAHGYLQQEDNGAADETYKKLGIPMAIAMHLRLATRLIDESRLAVGSYIYPDEAKEIALIQEALNDPNIFS